MSLINRAAVKARLLEVASNTRAQKFERVSKQTLDKMERRVEEAILHHVKGVPSKGKTL